MKLTRAGFLALLTGGVVGAQEHTPTHDTLEGKAPNQYTPVCSSPWYSDTKTNSFHQEHCDPADGYELCPMQHWQKPKYIRTKAEEILAEPSEETVSYHIPGNMEGLGGGSIMETYGINVSEDYVNQRICSTCGLVYFNPKDIQP